MFFSRRHLTCSVIILICLATFASGEATLPTDEVELLKEIATTLGKTDWNFGVDPCSEERSWANPNPVEGFENAVTCNCSFSNGTVCHVVSISLLGNRLTGSIPKEFGNITTLKGLSLEFNQLSGSIPSELGRLPLIERMFLSSNNFSGELPGTFADVTTLKDLVIQASGLDGPIPSGIFLLENLTDLIRSVPVPRLRLAVRDHHPNSSTLTIQFRVEVLCITSVSVFIYF
ncbi:probable leucine-rich repeat receptor-like serine/threonine-protein kinase At3g14840 isoform X2 [Cornus florida]|uniref:probable leucine-rich repeat receptor-like serine/threonine-protein kinase At3g14840 isoform X2 n=1 Tax=Cornus florida TaxID=4283 RepID=UPI00289FBCB7|nr:probable leucine-rich repeat receptor-like serine/threonine-protein kinase At3g14840 isoform X2 [Cornus florida]